MTGGMWAQSPQWRMDSFTVDAALPVATEPVYGIPDPSLQPMQLLSALSKDAGTTRCTTVCRKNLQFQTRRMHCSRLPVSPWAPVVLNPRQR